MLIPLSRWILANCSMWRRRNQPKRRRTTAALRTRKVSQLLPEVRQTYLACIVPGFIIDDDANTQPSDVRSSPRISQSPPSPTVPLPQSDASHDRHGWVDHLAVRYASGQGQTLQRPSLTMDVGDCPLDKQLLERVYADPLIHVVLLYCKVGTVSINLDCD